MTEGGDMIKFYIKRIAQKWYWLAKYSNGVGAGYSRGFKTKKDCFQSLEKFLSKIELLEFQIEVKK